METTLYQHCTNVVQRCFDVVSTSGTDVVSTLCDVENPTSDFVSFSTSDQRYFNVDPQRWNNVDPMLKCWLGQFCVTNKWMTTLKIIDDPKFWQCDQYIEVANWFPECSGLEESSIFRKSYWIFLCNIDTFAISFLKVSFSLLFIHLQLWRKYFRQTIVSMSSSALWEKFNFYFLPIFC